MKKTLIVASSLALVASLAACKKETEAPQPAESAAAGTGSMSNLPMAMEMKHGMGQGKVVSVDPSTGAISIEHGPIDGLGWSGMTMGFTAKPDLLKGIAKGDKVNFEIDWDGKEGAVTSIHKAE